MNIKVLCLAFVTSFVGLSTLKAQEVEDNMRMTKPFKADGISKEWNEPLNEYNTDTKLAFALANDDKNLYVIIESLDPQTTFSVLRGGITLNINTEGKKKTGINLVFPLMERPPVPKDGELPKDELSKMPLEKNGDIPHDFAGMNKTIRVSGFKNISDGDLPLENSYGIQAGMTIKPNRDLIYEISIPLSQLQVDAEMKKPLVYNIKINSPGKSNLKRAGSLEGGGKPGGRGGMGGGHGGGMGGGKMAGGMGGGRGGQRPPESGVSESKSSDFWIKFKLAKA
ncbi:hypothetical protein ACFOG5_00850 [Pedobacter fastidiosus]|uniref:Uncharacterized protein n=1 Tax=Pedobacter fastidiosus TaxID=2765361 RepID=A0ABR7KV21_9SPHI|nr:hypothetical protein [Pedobacter fastidiosus]MBC6111959.1 hypothetical protein [Pedobacter fastidiosus]